MARRNIVRAIRELRTAGPSGRLDNRIRAARDSALEACGPAQPMLGGWSVLFGLMTGLAGFAIGIVVARGFASDPKPSVAPQVRVRWVLSEQGHHTTFDFSQKPEPLFGRFFDREDSEQGVQQ